MKQKKNIHNKKERVFINKQAKHRYEILDTLEAGLVLRGCQVKSLRSEALQLTDAFVHFKNNECFLFNLTIPPYRHARLKSFDSEKNTPHIKLLLHRKEIDRLLTMSQEQQLTIIALRVYFNSKSKVKVCLGIAKGKKLKDRRETTKKREAKRDIERVLKRRNKNL